MAGGDKSSACSVCGTANYADDKFCENCGAKLQVSRTSITVVKVFAILQLVVAMVGSIFVISAYDSIILGLAICLQGILISGVLFVLSGIAEDLAAIRKNTSPKKRNE